MGARGFALIALCKQTQIRGVNTEHFREVRVAIWMCYTDHSTTLCAYFCFMEDREHINQLSTLW